ncbi:MAG TPA: class I SAM-dependent methyltransferase [Stellaceae bacterium]|nr:class I SAM-dependent methyltransferase [Stellaceae bacterium]
MSPDQTPAPVPSAAHVSRRIEEGNPWYIGDQFAVQLGAPGTRATVERNWQIFRDFIRRWARDGDAARPVRTLDCGCGDGLNLRALAAIAAELDRRQYLVGCDYNGLRLGRVRSAKLAEAAFRGSLLALPVAAGAFDILLCNHVLEHIVEDDVALREMHRVLAPGGLLILGVPNEGCAFARLRNKLLQRNIARTTDHVQFYRKATLLQRMAAAGFRIEDFRTIGFFVPHLRVFTWLSNRAWGRKCLEKLGARFPGQAAGLVVAAVRT